MSGHRIIWVSPLADGWAVLCAGFEPLVFRSGGRAEAAAKRLARSSRVAALPGRRAPPALQRCRPPDS